MTEENDNHSDNAEKLLELAHGKFPEFCPTDKKLFISVADGKPAKYCKNDKTKDNPANADKWGEDRIIPADRIVWLCTDRMARERVSYKGIQVKGAKVDGLLDLEFAKIPFQLNFKKCSFVEKIILQAAEVSGLFMEGTHTREISADGIKADGDIFLDDEFKAEGEVCLLGATIGGDLSCINGEFINPDGIGLDASGTNIRGSVYLREGFKVQGGVNIIGATVGGDLDCQYGDFINANGVAPKGKNLRHDALNANRINVRGSVYLSDGFRAEGEVRFPGADIGTNLECDNGEFINPDGKALNADGIKIDGNFFLRHGFKAEGEVRLLDAAIGKTLDCSKGEFNNEGGIAINADRINVKSSIFLNHGFMARGEVRFLSANIGNQLVCSKGSFYNFNHIALDIDGIEAEGSVFFNNGFKAEGEVRLPGATIRGNLECNNCKFINSKRTSFDADGIIVKGNVFFREKFEADGKVNFNGANVSSFVWINIITPEKVTLDLRRAKIGTLWDEEKSWPEKGNLFLHGLKYNALDNYAPQDAESRIEWLQLQPDDDFHPQPYEHLAEVLKKSGREEDAKKVLIAKNEDMARFGKMLWWERPWHWIKGFFISYGYRPLKPLWFIILFIILGYFIFGAGFENNVMAPPKTNAYIKSSGGNDSLVMLADYPKPNSLVYSLDTFIPLVNLHQTDYWLPSVDRLERLDPDINWTSWILYYILRMYFWIHIAAGWFLSSLLAIGLSGIARR